jgi:hypothetical protein
MRVDVSALLCRLPLTAAAIGLLPCNHLLLRCCRSKSTMAPVCDEGELAALTSMFKGNETAATAFCDKLTTRVTGIEEGLNTFFLTIMGALVFIMHAGFAMVSLIVAAAVPSTRSSTQESASLPGSTHCQAGRRPTQACLRNSPNSFAPKLHV